MALKDAYLKSAKIRPGLALLMNSAIAEGGRLQPVVVRVNSPAAELPGFKAWKAEPTLRSATHVSPETLANLVDNPAVLSISADIPARAFRPKPLRK